MLSLAGSRISIPAFLPSGLAYPHRPPKPAPLCYWIKNQGPFSHVVQPVGVSSLAALMLVIRVSSSHYCRWQGERQNPCHLVADGRVGGSAHATALNPAIRASLTVLPGLGARPSLQSAAAGES